MQLSIILVSYNVRPYLEQCLCALQKAVRHIDAEIWVVDNASSDDTVAFLRQAFPGVHLMANTDNVGFARANNQALAAARGQYVLFLNPDTLVAEDTLSQCLALMDSQPRAGALGIRMIDGQGQFLRESKRGLPTPVASLFKLAGLAGRYPRHRWLARYYAGHLDDHTTQPVEILAGAFMLVRKTVLDQVGSFDERFFMFGEDIDLSYRITQAGWENYYFAGSTLLHFKGQSTDKAEAAYSRHFFGAMQLFVQKHYTGLLASSYAWMLKTGIRLQQARFKQQIGEAATPSFPVAATSLVCLTIGAPEDIARFRQQFHFSQAAFAPLYLENGQLPVRKLKEHLGCNDRVPLLFCMGRLSYTAVLQWLDGYNGRPLCFFWDIGSSTIVGPDKHIAFPFAPAPAPQGAPV